MGKIFKKFVAFLSGMWKEYWKIMDTLWHYSIAIYFGIFILIGTCICAILTQDYFLILSNVIYLVMALLWGKVLVVEKICYTDLEIKHKKILKELRLLLTEDEKFLREYFHIKISDLGNLDLSEITLTMRGQISKASIPEYQEKLQRVIDQYGEQNEKSA